MRPFQLLMTPAAVDVSGFATAVTGTSFPLTANDSGDGLAHRVSILNNTANDHSAETLTIVGTDADGRALTDVISSPGGTVSVTSVSYFLTLTSITSSVDTTPDTFEIGWVDEFVSKIYPLDYKGANVALGINVTGTIDFTVEHTFDDIQEVGATGDFIWFDHTDANLVASVIKVSGNYIAIPRATRLKVNSYTTGATVEFNVNQQRPNI